jgi:1,4-dihydroxy-2-naphthoate octaprenyltransferase
MESVSRFRSLLLAARPKTLPAAVAPVVIGCALSWRLTTQFSFLLAAATLLSTLAIQIATNYFNDAVDARKGADTSARLGPTRATAAGLVSPRTMLAAGTIAVLIAILFSLPIVAARGWPIIGIGIVSLFFTYGYTGGPAPLAYRGLGECFVILFFGLIAVGGTVFVQTGQWLPLAWLAGTQSGLLSTALIAINNLRDIDEDSRSNKRTLAVRFGPANARLMIAAWCLLPALLGFLWTRQPNLSHLCWLPLPSALLGILITILVARTAPSRAYNRFLALAALHLVLWAPLFTTACLPS